MTYAVGVGNTGEVKDILELATEPDHKYQVNAAGDLETSLGKQMAENLAEIPISVTVSIGGDSLHSIGLF